MRRVFATIVLGIWIIPAVFFTVGRPALCVAQPVPSQEYDYTPQAIDSILNVADEAAKLPDIEQKVALLVKAAKILPASSHDDALRLLDKALSDLKDWNSTEKTTWIRRRTASSLRSKILSVYITLDKDKASALRKEFLAAAEDSSAKRSGDLTGSLRSENWIKEILNRNERADEAANIALSIMDTNPERASTLVVQSVAGGAVSAKIFDVLQKLKQNGNRALLSDLESKLGAALANTTTLDPFSLRFASVFAQWDVDMPLGAKNGYTIFFLNSLQTWVNLVKEASEQGGLDSSYIGNAFIAFSFSVRPVIARYSSPEQLQTFDLLLDQVSASVPLRSKLDLQILLPQDKSKEPRDILADILKEPNTNRRDTRLMGFALDHLRKSGQDFPENELAFSSEAIDRISDAKLKTIMEDSVTIARVNSMVKAKNFIAAKRLAESIPSAETRAWTMLALASAIKEDRPRALEFISSAIKTLDTASPTPKRVELALMAVTLLIKDDPQRAFELLSTAAKYANSVSSETQQSGHDSSRAAALDASIGDKRTILSQPPEYLADVEIDRTFALLGKVDWLRSQQTASEFRAPLLRLSLKLQFDEGILAKAPKQKSIPQKSLSPKQ